MARRVAVLPDVPPSIVIRRADGVCISPEWTGEELERKMERLAQLWGRDIIQAAMEAHAG